MERQRPQSSILSDLPSSLTPIPVAIAIVILGGIVLHFLGSVFLLFMAAVFLAIIFMPIVEWLSRRRIPMIFSILLVLAIVGGIFFIGALLFQTILSSMIDIAPKYQTKWEDVFMPAVSEMAGHVSTSLQQQVVHLDIKKLINGDGIASIVVSITTVVSNIALVLLFMFFILASNHAFRKKLDVAFAPRISGLLKKILEGIDGKVRRYLVTLILLNLFAASGMMLILTLFGVDLALLWSVLTFLLMFIPSVGSVIAAIIPITVAFVQFDSPVNALFLTVAVLSTQIVIGSGISTKLMGNSMNLSPLLILLSMAFWGWVWGPLGTIIAVPITSTLFVVFENLESLKPLAILMSAEPLKVKQGWPKSPH